MALLGCTVNPVTLDTKREQGADLPLISSVGAGPVKIVAPYTWGSHRSRLVKMLANGHNDVKLSPEDFDDTAEADLHFRMLLLEQFLFRPEPSHSASPWSC